MATSPSSTRRWFRYVLTSPDGIERAMRRREPITAVRHSDWRDGYFWPYCCKVSLGGSCEHGYSLRAVA